MDSKTSLLDAILYFADFEHCRQFMMELRWPDGVVKCPECGSERVVWLAKPRIWKCYVGHPKPTFSLKTGTIFEDSPLPLEKWLPTAWLIINCKNGISSYNCKNGISSYEVHRGLGVTQKTAWFMLHRIRLAMQDGTFNTLGGEVELMKPSLAVKRATRTSRSAKRRSRERAVKIKRLSLVWWSAAVGSNRTRRKPHEERIAGNYSRARRSWLRDL